MSLEQLTAGTTSWTGPYLYQPNHSKLLNDSQGGMTGAVFNKGNILAVGAQIPYIGALAGISRMALAVIHSLGHLFVAVLTCNEGHFFHALRGGAAFLQGLVESIPLIGRIFAIIHFHFPLIASFAEKHNVFKGTSLESCFKPQTI